MATRGRRRGGQRRGGRSPARLLLIAALAVGVALVPSLQARAKAAAVLADGAGLDVPRPFASSTERRTTTVDGVVGDLYSPGAAQTVILVPGAARQGRGDPRVVRLAEALARAGRAVFVPELALYAETFRAADIDSIARAAAALATRPEAAGRVVLLGFSFGGSLALVAAADPRAAGHVRLVATFGSYVDLLGVVQAATTGASLVEARREPWAADPRARELVRSFAAELVEPGQRTPLQSAVAGETAPELLPPAARAVYDLVTNTDPARTYPLAERLDGPGRDLLARFSPAAVASRLRVPVLAMHSRDDPAVPYGELLRLQRTIPAARTLTVASFRHVDLDGDGADRLTQARDLLTAWSFAGDVLAAQEELLD